MRPKRGALPPRKGAGQPALLPGTRASCVGKRMHLPDRREHVGGMRNAAGRPLPVAHPVAMKRGAVPEACDGPRHYGPPRLGGFGRPAPLWAYVYRVGPSLIRGSLSATPPQSLRGGGPSRAHFEKQRKARPVKNRAARIELEYPATTPKVSRPTHYRT